MTAALTDRIVDGVAEQLSEALPASTSFTFLDLNGLDLDPPPPPTILQRNDGENLFYAGALHWVSGEPESGKSWIAIVAAAEVLREGGRVLYLDYEDTARNVVERLRALGVKPEHIEAGLSYANPTEGVYGPQGKTAVGLSWMGQLANAGTYEFAVLDGVTESLVTHGADGNDNGAIATWINELVRPIIHSTGAAMVLIDHVAKSNEGRGRWAIGGQHKMAAVSGAAFSV